MKGLFWSLAATLVGVAMLVAGIAGVAGAFDGDESDSESADATDCDSPDPRFKEFNSIDLTGDAGRATLIATCQNGNVEVSMVATDFAPEQDRDVAVWLYNSRKDAELIDFTPQEAGDDTTVVSGSLPEDSERYRKVVVTEESFDVRSGPERPTKIILQGKP